MTKKSALILLIILTTVISLDAQTKIAKYAGEFMTLGNSARSYGMGGAFTGIANDVSTVFYNPAGLANLNYPQIALMHSEQFGDLVNYDYGAVAIPFQEDMSFGLSVMRLGVDGIPDTREALVDPEGNVVYDITDPRNRINPSLITEFSNQDWAFFLTFAKRYSDDFYWGVNAKIIRRDFDIESATGIGFDIGVYYIPMENLSLGASLQDATTTLISWSTGLNELVSPTLKIGGAYKLTEFLGGYLMPALDFDVRFENRQFASNFNIGPVSFDMHAGLEYTYQNLIYVRGGYNDVKQFSVGAGVKLPKLNIDYSFARFSESEIERLPDTHRISVMLTLEEPKFLRDGL
jgi:hypothetical protein